MLILGIESSCDETAAAVVEDGRFVRSNVIATQHALHAEFAGVVPEIASRAHLERILPVIRTAMREADAKFADLGAVAVGNRPGLIGSLLVGTAAAKALAWGAGKRLIAVDHIASHLHAAALNAEPISFPAVGLVVSGGHTSLFFMSSPIDLKLVGRTRDDAVGEAFDKAATILGAGYPGGPSIDRLARRGDAGAHPFPSATLEGGSLDFSFSGLKTALLYAVRGNPSKRGGEVVYERTSGEHSPRVKADFAASFERAAVDAIMVRLERCCDRFGGARTLVVGGGVSANTLLRRRIESMCAARDMCCRIPASEYCVDNAAMIAGHGWFECAAGRAASLSIGVCAQSDAGVRTGAARCGRKKRRV